VASNNVLSIRHTIDPAGKIFDSLKRSHRLVQTDRFNKLTQRQQKSVLVNRCLLFMYGKQVNVAKLFSHTQTQTHNKPHTCTRTHGHTHTHTHGHTHTHTHTHIHTYTDTTHAHAPTHPSLAGKNDNLISVTRVRECACVTCVRVCNVSACVIYVHVCNMCALVT